MKLHEEEKEKRKWSEEKKWNCLERYCATILIHSSCCLCLFSHSPMNKSHKLYFQCCIVSIQRHCLFFLLLYRFQCFLQCFFFHSCTIKMFISLNNETFIFFLVHFIFLYLFSCSSTWMLFCGHVLLCRTKRRCGDNLIKVVRSSGSTYRPRYQSHDHGPRNQVPFYSSQHCFSLMNAFFSLMFLQRCIFSLLLIFPFTTLSRWVVANSRYWDRWPEF